MRKTLPISIGVLFITLLGLLPTAALAEIDTEPTSVRGWGVSGLGPTNMTSPIKSSVFAMEQIGDLLYVGGRFTTVTRWGSELGQPYLAAFDVDTGEWVSEFNPVLNGPVYALEASPDGSRLYVGGEFSSVDGQANTEGLVALNPITGNVDNSWVVGLDNRWVTSRESAVMSIEITNDWIYVGGYFNSLNNHTSVVPVTRLGRVRPADGVADPNWTPNISGGSVWAVQKASNGTIFIGGRFTSVNGSSNHGFFAGLNNAGDLVQGLTTYRNQVQYGNNSYIQDVEVHNDNIFLGGSQHVIYMMNANTGIIERTHSTSFGGDYQDIEIHNSRVYASCHCYTEHFADYDWTHNFWQGNPIPGEVLITPIKFVAAYDANTGRYIDTFRIEATSLGAGVWAIHVDDNNCLWVGGDLTTSGIDQQRIYNMGRWCDDLIIPPSGEGGGENPGEEIEDCSRTINSYFHRDSNIARLYMATFLRNPDIHGFNYWQEQKASGLNLVDVAWLFAHSNEFEKTYGDLNNAQYVDLLYNNVMCRHSDPDGKAYWINQMNAGLSRGEVLLYFSQSHEFQVKTSAF